MKLVTVAEMRAIEAEAAARGLSYAQMMQNAGEGLADVVLTFSESLEDQPVVVGLVGTGNNGGDTLVALEKLAREGCEVHAYLVGERPKSDPYIQRILAAGGSVILSAKDKGFQALADLLSEANILLDGVLGTGIKLPLKPHVEQVLSFVSQFPRQHLIMAVDCPSGVDCESGQCAPQTIRANLTVCMAAVKAGLLKLPAFEKVGVLMTVDIGLPEDLATWRAVKGRVATGADVRESLPTRPLDAHKGSFGCALIAAGSINYTGAALLAGKAAYQIGSGLVRLAVPAPLHTCLAGHLPEATWLILPHEMGVMAESAAQVLLQNLEKATAMLVGPGLGTEETTAGFIRKLLAGQQAHAARGGLGFITASRSDMDEEAVPKLPPMVVDADGLRLLTRIDEWWKQLPSNSVLTPHPGEMSVLSGLSVEEIQADRHTCALNAAKKWQCVVVLKGAFTVVASPAGEIMVIPIATPALAKAGSGDALAGFVVGLLAQGVPAYQAAVAAAWMHGRAGVEASHRQHSTHGVKASDVIDALADVLEGLTGEILPD